MNFEEYRAKMQTATPTERAVLIAKVCADQGLTEDQRKELGAEMRQLIQTGRKDRFGPAEAQAWAEVSLTNTKLKGMKYEMELVLDKLSPSLEEDAITVFAITLDKLRGALLRRIAEKGAE